MGNKCIKNGGKAAKQKKIKAINYEQSMAKNFTVV